ncbi:hypothetical protein GSI_03372 [Ganoderma sinense ZZ0214-1]|uniref:Uncharacterized protein n=1 Tax=Ganoderma sinense ZZ0214-1 TaxID=1077348 RepID=A0A2G8SLI3_9APHY|nr:hypothetical protein GSI_03372 [Ganoderma sinense ZZ0214-1]
MPAPEAYRGLVRKLVVGIDVGTTFSGVSYAILDPGEVPSIHTITRYPGQENEAGNCKIPSILYYRQDGTLHSAGAEAAVPGMELVVEDEDLIFVEWFKLHLRPERLDADAISPGRKDLRPLAPNKTAVDVLADFLGYLLACTRRYIGETHGNGESLWNAVQDHTVFVLSHPNGWEGLQQSRMRQAAVAAGLVPNTSAGHARIHFVTEGEASLNFCINNGLATNAVQEGESVIIVDAGGGTVDVSSYRFLSKSPVSVEEATSPECILQGSTRVNVRLLEFLQSFLASSAFGNEEDLKSMVDSFEKSSKPVFKDEKEPSYIKFGTMKDNDPTVNIRRGQLSLTGAQVASFFRPGLEAIFDVIKSQRDGASPAPSTVFLVGGFAANPWLYSSLKEKLTPIGVTLYRPDSHTNKAVANGAVSFFLDHFVSSRVMKTTYGTGMVVEYNPFDPVHVARRHSKYIHPSGRIVLPHGFFILLERGTRVRENEEVSEPFQKEARDSKTLDHISSTVMCYAGRDSPKWTDLVPEMFAPLCTIHADTSQVLRESRQGPNGVYYVQSFKIILLCGLTEMQAQLSWVENGVEKRGPAKVVYDDDLRFSE